jgi:hypothetical protein
LVKLHLKDGRTVQLDLEDGAPGLEQLSRPDFQSQISAVTLMLKHQTKGDSVGVQYSLARPEGFEGDGQQWLHVERVEPKGNVKGGERIQLYVGDIRITLMAHASQPAMRVSVARVGRRKFNPIERRKK